MKKKSSISKFAIAIIAILLLNIPIVAQSKVGTTIGQFLKIDPSARVSGMGNAGTALYGEASSMYYNPASMGRLNQIDAQFTYTEWLAGITYNYAALGIKVENIGTFSLQAISLNSGDIAVTTVAEPHGTGEYYNVQDFALGIGYGLMLTDRVSVGFVVNYLSETIWHNSLTNFDFNLGVQYQIAVDGPTIGASLLNFGPRASYGGRDLYVDYNQNPSIHGQNDQLPAELRTDDFPMPTLFRIGISYPYKFDDDNKVVVVVDALHPNDNDESVNLGAELTLMKNFSIRGGYRNLFLVDSESGLAEGGLELGAGLNYDFSSGYALRFDYAWADYGLLLKVNRFTLSVGF